MKRNLFFICIFLVCQVYISGQELIHSYNIDELKVGFYSQYVDKKENTALTRMEPLHQASEHDFLDSFGHKYYLCWLESLHHIEKLDIPPSEFVLYTMSDDRQILCWLSTLHDSDSKENTKLRKSLQKKYGSIFLQGDTVLIPAKWFTGQLQRLMDPFVYGHEIVSEWLEKDSVDEGFIIRREKNQHHVYWRPSSLEMDASMIMKRSINNRVEVTMDGQRDTTAKHLGNERGMALFERDINRCIDNRLLPKELSYDKEYSVMLYLNEGGKARLIVLLPKELTLEDRLLLTVLATAVEYQPKHSFAGYISARGRFPAVYLKARFKGGQWFFHDYRFE